MDRTSIGGGTAERQPMIIRAFTPRAALRSAESAGCAAPDRMRRDGFVVFRDVLVLERDDAVTFVEWPRGSTIRAKDARRDRDAELDVGPGERHCQSLPRGENQKLAGRLGPECSQPVSRELGKPRATDED